MTNFLFESNDEDLIFIGHNFYHSKRMTNFLFESNDEDLIFIRHNFYGYKKRFAKERKNIL